MSQIRQGGFFISKIHQISGRIFTKKLKTYNVDEINQAQGKILFFLWQNDGISINEVAKKTALEKSTLTSMLDRLEAAGHIRREPCKNDRRKILIRVTNVDEEVKAAYEKVVSEMGMLYYKGFTEKEVQDCENYLNRIYCNLLNFEDED